MLNRFGLAAVLVFLTLPLRPAFGQTAATGDQFFAQGQFESARKAYAASSDPAAQTGLIRTLLRLDRWAEAVTAAQGFTAKDPSSADAHGLLALCLIRAGWQPPYADEAKQALALDPNNYWGLVASGRIADWDGHIEDARTLFRKASALHPEWPDALLGLLRTLDDDKDTAEKTAVTTKYLALNPQGQPFNLENEDLRDFHANAGVYQHSFNADPPFQQVEGGPSAKNAATLKVSFSGDWAVFPVTVNDQRFRLLFDTGAGDLVLTTNAAKRLKLPALAHSYLRGLNGREPSTVLKAGTMSLGDLNYRSIPIYTSGFSPDGSDGLLGGGTLDDCVIALDYIGETATLSPAKTAAAPAPLPGDQVAALPFRVYRDHLFLSVWVNGHPAWAMLDTGAQETVMSLRFAKEQLKDTPKDDYHVGTFHGQSGIGNTDQREDYVYSRAQSNITLSDQPPISVQTDTVGISSLDRESSPGFDFEIGLLLGASSFTYARRVTFDYPRHLLTFEYETPEAAPTPKPKSAKK